MATQRSTGPFAGDRRFAWAVLAALVLIPLLAFGVGPLSGDSFSLGGPAGPLLAFSAGVLSFVSPCVLPIVPIYIGHLSGATVHAGRVIGDRRVTFFHAVAFISGLSFVFIVLGTSVGLLGSYFVSDHQRELEQLAGILLAAMGILLLPEYGARSPLRSALALFGLTAVFFFVADLANLRDDRRGLLELGAVTLLAWLRFSGYLPLRFFSRTFEVNVGRNRPVSYTRSALIGGGFALGWTPCIGPVLTGILAFTANQTASTGDALTGTYLLFFYALGFSVPFLVTGLMLSEATTFFRRIQRYAGLIEVISAVMLVGVGLLLWYGRLTSLNSYFTFADFNGGL